jgi:hypothetical protein
MLEKEQTMDEYDMTEQDLREEHLQQITGGCGECDHHAFRRDNMLDLAANARWQAEGHAARGDLRAARLEADFADFYTKMAKIHQRSLENEQRYNPGHPNYEPLFKKRRLQ